MLIAHLFFQIQQIVYLILLKEHEDDVLDGMQTELATTLLQMIEESKYIVTDMESFLSLNRLIQAVKSTLMSQKKYLHRIYRVFLKLTDSNAVIAMLIQNACIAHILASLTETISSTGH